MLVISYALGLLPIDPRVVLALRSVESAVLKRPVGLGDTIRVRAKVTRTRPLGEETGLVTLDVRILNQSDELTARMDIVVLWRREPQPPAQSNGTGGRAAASEDDELSPLQDGRVLA
jgi:hypothetical protein